MPKNIYISWHYTTHGIAYFKHILSAFYKGELSIKDNPIRKEGIEQIEMNDVFSHHKNGFLFDKAYYLHVGESVIEKLTDRRFKYRPHMYERDDEVEKTQMQTLWKEVIGLRLDTIQAELNYVKKQEKEIGKAKVKLFEEQLWRDMQHFRIEEQLWWWKEKSNAANYYDETRLEPVLFDTITDLRDEQQIATEVQKWLKKIVKKHGQDAQYFINVSLGTNETQAVWFVLSEAGFLPANTRFLKTNDDKSDGTNKRFKQFAIIEVDKTILADIKYSLRVYENAHSSSRKLANLKMQTYIKQGFAILILGERGTGKSKLIEEFEAKGRKTSHVNCASFDDDNKAESELFGYKKGAFTGANTDQPGLFHEARNGILFFDEVHHLSKTVQGKLMKALQTDSNNQFRFRRLGEQKEEISKFTAVFASNLPLEELKKTLLPDFFDRISQLIIELPPLRETPEEIEKDWEMVWDQLKFRGDAPKEKDLMKWLKIQPLYGNYRDLQKIAIYYKSFKDLPQEAKELEDCESPFEFAKKQFEKYYSDREFNLEHPLLKYLLDEKLIKSPKIDEKTGDMLTKRFQRFLVDWIEQEFPNKKPYELLKIASKTYYNWKEGADTDPPEFYY